MIAAAKIKYLQDRIARFDDQFAYKELFVSFYNPLLLFATSFTKSKEQGEEIISDVFIKLWEKRKQIDNISNLRVYLYIATKNITLNYIAKENRSAVTELDEVSVELKSIYANPEQILITAEMIHLIKEAINKLPPKCKIIFKLVKEDELKYREVAEILDISSKTVENQVSIALKRIAHAVQFDINRAFSPPSHPLF